MKIHRSIISRVVAFGFLSVALSSAATFNLVTDFNLSNSAAGPFVYGQASTPSGFSRYTTITSPCLGKTLESCYTNANGGMLYYNGSLSLTSFGTIRSTRDFLDLDPQGSTGVDVRFIAPADGLYSFSGFIKGQDTSQQSSTYKTYVNGLLFGPAGTITAYNVSTAISFAATPILAGSTIDFIVQSSGGSSNRTVGLNGVITSSPLTGTPEPATWIGLGTGLAGILVLRRRKSA